MRRLLHQLPAKALRLLSLSLATILLGNVHQARQPLPTSGLGWTIWSAWAGVVALVALLLGALLVELIRRPPAPPTA